MLPPEIESGNKEYKWKIDTECVERLNELASQMKWRLNEGDGVAYYYLGVEDDGTTSGISLKLFKKSMENIKKICKLIDVKVSNVKINFNEDNTRWTTITIRTIDEHKFNYRIVFIGPSQNGKTTLISNLTNKLNDNGEGKSRKLVFNHKHEIYSGITSSISIKTYDTCDLHENKILLNLIDTPGSSKYLKTAISALLKYKPNLILLCIDPLLITNTELEYFLRIIRFLKKKYIVVFIKKDKYTLVDRNNILSSINKILKKGYDNFVEISNITRFGYNKLLEGIRNNIRENEKERFNFNEVEENIVLQICDVISIPNFDKIYTALLLDNIVNIQDKYYLSNSEYTNYEVSIKSIFYLNKPKDKVNGNKLLTFTLNDLNTNNKSDIIISNKHIKSFSSLVIKCKILIKSKQAVCMYNNQYCNVYIKKIDEYRYKLTRDGKFINLSNYVILRDKSFYLCKLEEGIE